MTNNVPEHKRTMAWRRLPFWDRVDSEIEPVTESGCLIFTGGQLKKGYGIAHDNGKHKLIHRAMWEKTFGSIPDGLMVLHRCDVPSCVNPNHLFLGTALENNRDREKKGRGRQVVGAKHVRPQAKLSEAAVAKIRGVLLRDNSHGVCARLAKEYGVSQATISSIRHWLTWKHVGDS